MQAAENDEATTDASAVFLDFNEGAFYQGDRIFGAVHLASLTAACVRVGVEHRPVPDDPARPAGEPEIPVQGFHTTLAYFLTGEKSSAGRRRASAALPPL